MRARLAAPFAIIAALALILPVAQAPGVIEQVVNGGFELGMTGWSVVPASAGTIARVAPGATGSAHALSVSDSPTGSYVTQRLVEPIIAATDAASLILQFDARMDSAPNDTAGYQWISVQHGAWDPASGAGAITAQVGLEQHQNGAGIFSTVRVIVFAADSNVGYFTIGGPRDLAWHHYELVLDTAARTATLLIDGSVAMNVMQPGWPVGPSVASPDRILVGDVDPSNAIRGEAPAVTWDGISFGFGAGP